MDIARKRITIAKPLLLYLRLQGGHHLTSTGNAPPTRVTTATGGGDILDDLLHEEREEGEVCGRYHDMMSCECSSEYYRLIWTFSFC